jgi:hypothetical protein
MDFTSRQEILDLYCEALLMAQGEAGFMQPDRSHLQAMRFMLRNQFTARAFKHEEIKCTMDRIRERLAQQEEDYAKDMA